MQRKSNTKVKKSEIKYFFLKSETGNRIGFSRIINLLDIKILRKRMLYKTNFRSMPFYFSLESFIIGNVVFKQDIGIPVGIDSVPYREKHFLYIFLI